MGKKKYRKKSRPGPLSPKNYIKKKARQLPIYECLISDGWDEAKYATIVVARQHANGHITCAVYGVDLSCTGVSETDFAFNLLQPEYEQVREELDRQVFMKSCEYTLVHNVIYGALAFAEKHGLQPHKDFQVTQYLLEDAAADIESQDIELGEDGIPCIVTTYEEAPRHIISRLEMTGADYKVIYLDDLEDPDMNDDMTEYDDFEEKEYTHPDGDPLQIIDDLYEQQFSQQKRAEISPQHLKLQEYRISFDGVKFDYFSPGEDEKTPEKLHKMVTSGKVRKVRKAIRELKPLIEKFPGNPIYYNYLANALQIVGEMQAAEQLIEETWKKFPDYLFARCNYAHLLFRRKAYEEISEVFDNTFELKLLYPDRDEFHISEVMTFYAVLCRYFTAIDELQAATVCGKVLSQFDEWGTPLSRKALFEMRAKKYEKLFGQSLVA